MAGTFTASKANFQAWAASRPRAKAGGETIGETFFKGGQFISQDAMAKHLGISVEVVNEITKKYSDRLLKAVERAKQGSLSSMAYIVQQDAKQSIKQRKDKDTASEPGMPPHQHTPGFFKRGIRYSVDKQREDAVIGFLFSRVGRIAETHEKGLIEDRRRYPERPTMGPALERNVDHFASDWRGKVA